MSCWSMSFNASLLKKQSPPSSPSFFNTAAFTVISFPCTIFILSLIPSIQKFGEAHQGCPQLWSSHPWEISKIKPLEFLCGAHAETWDAFRMYSVELKNKKLKRNNNNTISVMQFPGVAFYIPLKSKIKTMPNTEV